MRRLNELVRFHQLRPGCAKYIYRLGYTLYLNYPSWLNRPESLDTKELIPFVSNIYCYYLLGWISEQSALRWTGKAVRLSLTVQLKPLKISPVENRIRIYQCENPLSQASARSTSTSLVFLGLKDSPCLSPLFSCFYNMFHLVGSREKPPNWSPVAPLPILSQIDWSNLHSAHGWISCKGQYSSAHLSSYVRPSLPGVAYAAVKLSD